MILLCAAVPVAAVAQSAGEVLQDVIETYRKSRGISADYVMTYD